MALSREQLWKKIKDLEGELVYTKTRQIPNKILRVTDKTVVIEGRTSTVSFEGETGIFENYETLVRDRYLVGKSGEDGIMSANFLHGWYVIMAILHKALPDETEQIKGGIRWRGP